MSLVADYGNSSSSNDSDSSNFSDYKDKLISINDQLSRSQNSKLPTPNLDTKITQCSSTSSCPSPLQTLSVFSNPFLEAEHAAEAILQKHVQMVNKKDLIKINGKKICWNYRKGRCRFGHKCKYAHDSDVQKSSEQLEVEKEAARAHSVVCQSLATSGLNTIKHSSEELEQTKQESIPEKKVQKRPGLCNGLIPGKKIMKKYINQHL